MSSATKSTRPLPIDPALDPAAIRRDAGKLAADPATRVLSRGDFEVLDFHRDEAPALFHELTRQREITFRLSGQGTGLGRDQTREDAWYRQLVLWDRNAKRIAGAYRLGFTAEVLPDHGLPNLYLSHMFHFDPGFFSRDSRAVELTRSFVAAAYQNDRIALPLLWQGLGAMVRRHGIQRLFGSVTLSPDFSNDSRRLMTSWLHRHRLHPGGPLATARLPFPSNHPDVAAKSTTIDELRPHITDRTGKPKPIPPLLRHYLSLGATFHAFHREPSFNDAIYCLLEVEVSAMPLTHARRFIGEEISNRFPA